MTVEKALNAPGGRIHPHAGVDDDNLPPGERADDDGQRRGSGARRAGDVPDNALALLREREAEYDHGGDGVGVAFSMRISIRRVEDEGFSSGAFAWRSLALNASRLFSGSWR